MENITRKQRINFGIIKDLQARHRICAIFKGWTVRKSMHIVPEDKSPHDEYTLVRTTSFIKCNVCSYNNIKYAVNCNNCDIKLSNKLDIRKNILNRKRPPRLNIPIRPKKVPTTQLL